MAQTATSRRKTPTRSARGKAAAEKKRSIVANAGTGGRAAGGARRAAESARGGAQRAAERLKPKPKRAVSRLAGKAALKALKVVGRKALKAGERAVRATADRATDAGRNALETGLSRRLPIQVSIDVAVPLAVAWDEWTQFDYFSEGVHRIEDLERDGDRLFGRTAGPLSTDWEAEIVDEREQEAFAWRSVEGSDCAGLVTFHRLSDRLTRIEVDLDVLPTSPAETLALSLHLAHRRAETELRRFKARVEFINPDVYEAELDEDGRGPEADGRGPETEQDQ